MFKFRALPLCAGIAVVQFLALPALAQKQIEEVVVTARKKSESLQEVPLAITAFSGDKMERSDFVNLDDVASNTVGMNYSGESSSGYQSSPTIRGLRQGFATDRVQNVAIFLDGIYLSRQSMANMGMVDMERIEVVKGPQNSLYGRNAFAGAINYVTKKPTDEFEGYSSATRGTDNREDYRFSISGPLIENKLFGRYSVGTSDYDGHTRNDHPFAHVDPQGFTDGGADRMLGGWEDYTYNFGLRWLPTDTLEVNLSYYNTELQRENAPSYTMAGVRETARFQADPYDDMNFNPVCHLTNVADKAGASFTGLASCGYTLYKGALKTTPVPGTWIGTLDATINPDGTISYVPGTEGYNWGFGDGVVVPDQRGSGIVIDPRGYGFIAKTEIYSLGLVWDISENWSMTYLAGFVDHSGSTAGIAERDPLFGYSLTDNETGQRRRDVEMQSNVSTARPIVESKTWSHELRFDWSGSDVFSGSFGGYFSDTEDEQYELTSYNPICTTPDRLYDEDQDASTGCYLPFGAGVSPLAEEDAQGVGIYNIFRDAWSGQEANLTRFDEQVYAIFGVLEYNFTPDVTFRAEARYSVEKKGIERLTDTFALAGGEYGNALGQAGANPNYPNTGFDLPSAVCGPDAIALNDPRIDPAYFDPNNPRKVVADPTGDPNAAVILPYLDATDSLPVACIAPADKRTFRYFTPKLSIDWQLSENSMVYGYVAKGLKAGGYNNTSNPDQGIYDEEVNYTYEIGAKNSFLDGALTLNTAIYYVDWDDLVGSQSPTAGTQSPTAGVVQANIGDVENWGFEIEGKYYVNDKVSIDFGAAYTDPRYEDGTFYDEAVSNFYYQCTPENLLTDTNPDGTPIGGNFDSIIDFDERCGNGDIGGNELIKVSKEQYTLAFNYNDDLANGWSVNLRLDGNYQSRQWIDPLNLAYMRSRTLWNTSLNFQAPENWEFTIWGKNITDKEYVSGSFLIGIFNKHIVSLGASRSFGATAKYKF